MTGTNLPALKTALNAPSVKLKFEEMLGKRASQFMTSITSVVQNNNLLQKADVNSIIMGAAIAASMDLPLHPSLGYAALVPFNSKNGCQAQLQIEYKGLIELFMRSGQCKSIVNEVVREGQLIKKNIFTGEYVFDENAKTSDKIIGVMAYFKLCNGFEKYDYMTIEEVKAHAQKYSKSYRNNAAIWKDEFENMAKKTVLRRLLSRYAPKSLEMQQAAIFDNSVVNGDINELDNATPNYLDNANVKEVEVTDFEEAEVIEETGEVVSEQVQATNQDDDF
jgi:recombination protein RecT